MGGGGVVEYSHGLYPAGPYPGADRRRDSGGLCHNGGGGCPGGGSQHGGDGRHVCSGWSS